MIMPRTDEAAEVVEKLRKILEIPEHITDLQINISYDDPIVINVTYYPNLIK